MLTWLVAAHRDVEQFERTVRQVAETPGSLVVVHVDRKTDIGPFEDAVRSLPNVVFVPDRVRVNWGGFSQVQASLNLLATGLRLAPSSTHFALISGDTYLLRSPSAVAAYFEAHAGTSFLDAVAMPAPEVDKKLTRISRLHVEQIGTSLPAPDVAKRVMRSIPQPWRRAVGSRTLHAGSSWWVITSAAASHVIDAVRRKDPFVRLCRRTVNPDEHFFQTLLLASEDPTSFRPMCMYTTWDAGAVSPKYIGLDDPLFAGDLTSVVDTDEYGRHEYVFARKFADADGSVDARLRASWR